MCSFAGEDIIADLGGCFNRMEEDVTEGQTFCHIFFKNRDRNVLSLQSRPFSTGKHK